MGMKTLPGVRFILAWSLAFGFIFITAGYCQANETGNSTVSQKIERDTITKLISLHGEDQRDRIERGVKQAAYFWWNKDGTGEQFKNFCIKHFISDPVILDKALLQLEKNYEAIRGSHSRVAQMLEAPLQLAGDEPLPLDHLFADYSPHAHFSEDMFGTKVAFAVVLNFPHYSLEEQIKLGETWSRTQWARAAAGNIFTARVPARVNQMIGEEFSRGFFYLTQYKIYMGRVLDKKNRRLFADDAALGAHWGLRDKLSAFYGEPGLKSRARQEAIYRVMLRIIDQTIPQNIIDNNDLDWNPYSNLTFKKQKGKRIPEPSPRENGKRYEYLHKKFRAEQELDKYYPSTPTKIQRAYNRERKLPGVEVKRLLKAVLSSPNAEKIGRLIVKRLKRPLRPYDIWYTGFSSNTGGTSMPEEELDRLVKKNYPNIETFEKKRPGILSKMGFSRSQIELIVKYTAIEPARGVGYATPIEIHGQKSRALVRQLPGGLIYRNMFTGLHEFGHCTECVFSFYKVDRYLLAHVPNGAISEVFAFIFGDRVRDCIGLPEPGIMETNSKLLDQFWKTYEIAGVSLMEINIWEWMYQHPNTSARDLQEAVIRIAKDTWNRYFAPVFRTRDTPILAIYSHIFLDPLYLSEYPLAFLIRHQISRHLEGKNLGAEMERMCKTGNVTPDLWIKKAVGASLSEKPFLDAVGKALLVIKK